MAEFTFKLKSDAKEYPARFGGNEVKLSLPATLEDIRVQDGVNRDDVYLGLINGQGIRLTRQKKVKDVLGSDKYKDRNGTEHNVKEMDVAAALELARDEAENMVFGAPKVRGEGGRRSKRVEEAEAKAAASAEKAESASSALRDTYLAAPASFRKMLRTDLVSRGIFTEEQMDELDAVAKK